eukprot:12887740-Prorocentrum_lima.AAC.1
MLLSLTNGHSDTLTTTDIALAFLNEPMDDSMVILVAVPHYFDQAGSCQARHCLGAQKSGVLAGWVCGWLGCWV